MKTPWFTGDFGDDDRAMIAGFILHYRRGFLQALSSVGDPAAASIPQWQASELQFFRDAERLTRFLLYWIGYPVEKDQLWEDFIDVPGPPIGSVGRADAFSPTGT